MNNNKNRARQTAPISELRLVYDAWLQTPAPDFNGALRVVAGERIREALRQTVERAGVQQALPEFLAHWKAGRPVWIWSDLHLGHEAILRHAQRPFGSAQHMQQGLRDKALSIGITPTDWLVCLGDLSFVGDAEVRAWLRDIPGRKLLILGNHDVDGRQNKNPLRWGMDVVTDCLELPAGPHQRLWLTHYPIGAAHVPDGVINVHGHIHQRVIDGGRHLNVCVEHTGYGPVLLQDGLDRPHRTAQDAAGG